MLRIVCHILSLNAGVFNHILGLPSNIAPYPWILLLRIIMHNTSTTHQPNSQQQMAKSLNYNVLTIDWCSKCNTIMGWQTCVWSHCICDLQTLLEAPFIAGQGPCCLKPIICTPLTIVGSYLFNTTPFTIVHRYFDSLPLLLCVGLSQLR